MTEEWRPVVGYEGYYEVSDLGGLRSLNRVTRAGRRIRGVPMRLTRKYDGHLQVKLRRDGSCQTLLVHRLVLIAFAGPPPEGCEVLHIDGNPANNVLRNLRWGTKSENMRDQVRHGSHIYGRRTACPKGHPYDADNTYLTPRSGYRKCRACKRYRESLRPKRRSRSQ